MVATVAKIVYPLEGGGTCTTIVVDDHTQGVGNGPAVDTTAAIFIDNESLACLA